MSVILLQQFLWGKYQTEERDYSTGNRIYSTGNTINGTYLEYNSFQSFLNVASCVLVVWKFRMCGMTLQLLTYESYF